MKAKFKTPVIHDVVSYELPKEHVSYLVEIFEMSMKSAASIGAKSVTFLTEDFEVAKIWRVTGYELRIERQITKGQCQWRGAFYSANGNGINEDLVILGTLE